jgi:coproporphyrinogen III oxidase-like Fe-S oxidoreductase
MEPEEALAPDTRAMEALLMGLRLAEGVDLARIAAESGVPIDRLVRADAIARLARMGLIAQAGTRLHVPERGMLLLDAILPEVVAV